MQIDKILDNDLFVHHYQPIYELKGREIVAFEALLRPFNFSNPEEVFTSAIQEKKLYELDSRSIHKAIKTYNDAGFSKKEGFLFVNVYPSTIMNKNFPSHMSTIMKDKNINNQQIVLEINENETIHDMCQFKEALAYLKKQGFFYAIDDYGRGFNDLEKLLELEPQYVKLDRYAVQNVTESKKKQEMIKLIVQYCNKFNISLIAEGLESPKEIFICQQLGIQMGQGYELGKPGLL